MPNRADVQTALHPGGGQPHRRNVSVGGGMKPQIAIFALIVLCGCATRPPPAPPARADKPKHLALSKDRVFENAVLNSYRRERGCEGPSYGRAQDYAASRLDTAVSVPTEPRSVSDAADSARFRVRLAEAAARKKCVEQARSNYEAVVQTFTGPPYAAVRKRAATGLSRLPGGDS